MSLTGPDFSRGFLIVKKVPFIRFIHNYNKKFAKKAKNKHKRGGGIKGLTRDKKWCIMDVRGKMWRKVGKTQVKRG